ncbi:MAG: PGPGW domain-containing protein [Nocardioidaceae bacterium]
MALRKTWVTIVGWVLVLLGVAALVLPGPGLLLLLSGLVVLSQEYAWAERRVEPVKKKAFEVARLGVSTYPRILLSGLSACVVMAVGVYWGLDPPIPSVGPLGPDLPFGGWATGASIIVSGLVAMALLVYSIKRFRAEALAGRRAARAARAARAEERAARTDESAWR